jgi:predicted DNA-binding protein
MGTLSKSKSNEDSTATIELEPKLVRIVRKAAQREKVTPKALVRRAVERYLEDLQDYHAATAALKRNRGKPTIPWTQVKKELGLAG